MKKINNQSGITLVALVITIIILLILAGIAITQLTGDNGLFVRAKQAKNNTLDAQNTENAILADYIDKIDEVVGNTENSKTYNIGEEVTVGGENFYVIADKGTTVELLAKYVLNVEATEQINSEIGSSFSTSNYWKDETLPSSSPYFNLNTYPAVKNDTESAVYKANSYAISKGAISGRLLTYEEANNLKDGYTDMIYVTYGNAKCYWLGSANDTRNVWFVYGQFNSLHNDFGYSYTSFLRCSSSHRNIKI